MADGVALPAAGVTAATDDAGAAGHVQLVKLAVSTDGSATPVPAGSKGMATETGPYDTVDSGEFAPGVAVAQFPTITCRLARIKARAANAGNVYVGPTAVTKADGATDTTTGLELQPGDDTGWLPVDNLNRFYGIGDNAADSVTYLTLA